MWHRECEQNIHEKKPHNLDLVGSLGLGKAKAKAKTFMRCPRGSGKDVNNTCENYTANNNNNTLAKSTNTSPFQGDLKKCYIALHRMGRWSEILNFHIISSAD